MPELLTLSTSVALGSNLLVASQKEGDPQRPFAQILEEGLVAAQPLEPAERLMVESPPLLKGLQIELSDQEIEQLVADLKVLFSTSDAPVIEDELLTHSDNVKPATDNAPPQLPASNLNLELADESIESDKRPTLNQPVKSIDPIVNSSMGFSGISESVEQSVDEQEVVVPDYRQAPTRGGNDLPLQLQGRSPEPLLSVVNKLPPEQFDKVIAQLPEIAELLTLSRERSGEGAPLSLNNNLKGTLATNGSPVLSNTPTMPVKAPEVFSIENEAETASENENKELQKNIQASGYFANTNTNKSITQYRAQIFENATQSAAAKGDSGGDTASISLDGVQGNKAQQHDRLMAAVSAMRQGLVAEQRSVESRQRGVSELINSHVSNDEGDGSFEGLVSTAMPVTGSQPLSTAAVSLPLQHPRWGQSFSEKVVWMMNAQLKEAEIKLNPASLGSIEIKLSLIDDQANVTFNVHSVQAKEALESAIPRLREMLAEGGIALNDANVSDQSEQKDEDQQALLTEAARAPQEEQTDHDEVAIGGIAGVYSQTAIDVYI